MDGARVIPVISADAAHKVLSELQPDVLISDIGLPGEDGYTFIRQYSVHSNQIIVDKSQAIV